MLARAIEAEVAEFLAGHAEQRDAEPHLEPSGQAAFLIEQRQPDRQGGCWYPAERQVPSVFNARLRLRAMSAVGLFAHCRIFRKRPVGCNFARIGDRCPPMTTVTDF